MWSFSPHEKPVSGTINERIVCRIMAHYARTLVELRDHAVMFWPKELMEREAAASSIPLLLKTQDKFISLLDIADARPDAWKMTLQSSKELPANLFLKHLMVLSDISGERLKRLSFESIFPDNTMTYVWREKTYTYRFKEIIGKTTISNAALFIDGKRLINPHELNGKLEDIIMLILYGQAILNDRAEEMLPDEIKDKCMIGSLIGNSEELQKFVKQRYIWVSRIVGGATANAMGQMTQNYVLETLQQALPTWRFRRDGTIPGISHNQGKTGTRFDIVAHSPSNNYVAIEVCFQVTTNSVIERKAGQAEARVIMLRQAGHKIAYVIDGAGNFERTGALRTICNNSDCTVAFSQSEIHYLVQFLQEIN